MPAPCIVPRFIGLGANSLPPDLTEIILDEKDGYDVPVERVLCFTTVCDPIAYIMQNV